MVFPSPRLPVAGYCPEAIHEAAAKERADLIIISTHGRTGFRRALVGSVAEGTVRSAICPVLVVPSFACYAQKVCRQKRAPARNLNFATKSAQSLLNRGQQVDWRNSIGPTSPSLKSDKSHTQSRAKNAR